MRFFSPRRPWYLVVPLIIIVLLGIGYWHLFPQSVQEPFASPQENTGRPTGQVEDGLLSSSNAIRITGLIAISGTVTGSQEEAGLLDSPAILAGKNPILEASQPEPAGLMLERGEIHPRDAVGKLPPLSEFIRQVSDGLTGVARGIYVPGRLALRIKQQPSGEPGYIEQEDGTATQFQNAAFFGVVGLLAHNFLSGRDFLYLEKGQEVSLVYGDGQIQAFRITEIDDFQRLSPNDLGSDFVELANSKTWTVDQVFARFYQGSPHLVLQTCIERGGDLNWGVRFIVAEP